LTPAFVAAVWCAPRVAGLGAAAAGLFVLIAASDVLDGRLARRYGSESSVGRVVDHLADIGFILAALSTYVVQRLLPWWVPAAAGGAFVFYVLDSWAHGGSDTPRLIGSRVGHLGGICNYGLVGILAFNNTASLHLLPPEILAKLFWLVPLYSAGSVLSRLLVWRPQRRGRTAGSARVTLRGQKL
jgi:phosphatidylglycerophosphate synthase